MNFRSHVLHRRSMKFGSLLIHWRFIIKTYFFIDMWGYLKTLRFWCHWNVRLVLDYSSWVYISENILLFSNVFRSLIWIYKRCLLSIFQHLILNVILSDLMTFGWSLLDILSMLRKRDPTNTSLRCGILFPERCLWHSLTEVLCSNICYFRWNALLLERLSLMIDNQRNHPVPFILSFMLFLSLPLLIILNVKLMVLNNKRVLLHAIESEPHEKWNKVFVQIEHH